MRRFLALFTSLLLTCFVSLAQSGRKAPKSIPQPSPTLDELPPPKPGEEVAPVTAEKNEDYSCSDDGSLIRIVEKESDTSNVFSPKAVDVRAEITDRPKPSYTKEANRAGIQGYVILRVVLTATGEVGSVRVVRRLRYGLTENAIRVACKIKFKPAIKNGRAVSQWLNVEYPFRLADSSVYRR
ncbi:MAG TPA: energy transducer TonB [Pyrinomonadaceae bacterium]